MICHHPRVAALPAAAPPVAMDVAITIGPYLICPHPAPDGRVFIEVQLVEGIDEHHRTGPSIVLDLDKEFESIKEGKNL